VLLALGSPETLLEARDLLARLRQSAEATHSTWRVMEITAMQAVLKEAEGQREEALALLGPVVLWAEPQGFVRLFVDLGPRMAELLEELRRQGVAPEYISQILAAFAPTDDGRPTTKAGLDPSSVAASTLARGPSSPPAADATGGSVELLTNRELEVLELMAQRLTNKEIATQLVLSVGTVKQHAYNINQKLNVKGRRQAVTKATSLGILART
jgi:LuxR family maltose regulon positive regulatory protein